jgi:antitoxin HicB
MVHVYKIPIVLSPQPEGGYTVTSPVLPELITEGDSVEEALGNVRDALLAVSEIYADEGRSLPANLEQDAPGAPIWCEFVIAAA